MMAVIELVDSHVDVAVGDCVDINYMGCWIIGRIVSHDRGCVFAKDARGVTYALLTIKYLEGFEWRPRDKAKA